MRWVLSPASIRIRIFLSRFHECFSTMEYFHHLINSVRLISDGMLLAFVPKWLCNEIFFRRSSRNERLRARLNNGAKQHFRSVKLIFFGTSPRRAVGEASTYELCQETISFFFAAFCLLAFAATQAWSSDTGTLIFYMIADWKINEWQIFNKKENVLMTMMEEKVRRCTEALRRNWIFALDETFGLEFVKGIRVCFLKC